MTHSFLTRRSSDLLILSLYYFKFEKFQIFEFPIIVLLSVLGMFILISSNDLIVLYLAIELQSFCFYILSALKKYSNLSIEAALKYFIQGSFSSAMLLFGISRSEEHTSELQSLMRISYAVFCLKTKKT